MRIYPVSSDRGWPENFAGDIARVIATALLYKRADCLPVLIRLRIPPQNESERQIAPATDWTLDLLTQTVGAEINDLLGWMDKRGLSGAADSKILFFCADNTTTALAEIDLFEKRLSIGTPDGGMPGMITTMMDQMDCPIEHLSLVEKEQWPKMLIQPSPPSPYFEYPLPLITYLRQAMRKYPDNIAYVYDDNTLTYARLDTASDKLAFILAQQDVKKGDLVFIALDNSIELPVAYIACMKLGAVFAPVDIQWPEKRFNELAESIRPKAIVSKGLSCPGSATIPGNIRDWQTSSATISEEIAVS